MNKKLISFICLLVIVSSCFTLFGFSVSSHEAVYAETKGLDLSAKAAYLVDYSTGTVVYQQNATDKRQIASMVKIMVALLTFEAIESGNLSMDNEIQISDTAASMGGSQLFLEENLIYPVHDLIKGVVVCSANDAAVALGETISGSVEGFVGRMNERAKELNATDTNFVNCTGLPAPGQYSTARDVSLMTRELLKHKAYYEFAGIWMEDYTHPDGRVTQIVNTNKLIRFYDGCDAGKTGFTNEAMFCLSATAKRNGMRVVATVLGEPDSKTRFADVKRLFNYAFANYENKVLVSSSDNVADNIEIKRGKCNLTARVERDVCAFQKKGDKGNYSLQYIFQEDLKAPISKGEKVGVAYLVKDGIVVDEINLVCAYDVNKMNYGDGIRKIILNW